ncbi:hypothetical protein BCR44DRAFT_1437763 [Catenaria anguillulae PL171]|uniref:BAR domain-containing protein n=1 Tax=Catenaria anguillulae PL171 TaxID=765915 RepID=A0A1Y2HHX0_9FUNG|nr:hypothetical protein BCR44DRAFT_1437763 [Catenaria anguillulae PL171]
MDSLLKQLNGLGTQLSPIAKNIERGFGTARQMAQEKLGSASDLTELPPEYIDLEHKIDAIHATLSALLKTHGHTSQSVIPTAVSNTFFDITKSIKTTAAPVLAQTPIAAAVASDPNAPPPPPTANHALARICVQSADTLGQEPLAAALRKLATSEEKLGDAQVSLKSETAVKFTAPIGEIVNDRLANVSRARRNVTTTRLQLDGVKSRFKSASPQRAEELQVELEKAEDVFVDAVEEATKLMKSLVESPAILRHIADLVAQHLAYHKLCVQVLTELAPEIDEMQMTQQAMYNTDK